eukprot:TRINITY_DN3516_c0_g2_i1.p1 TRINITY_DN3516_c0_g2~~TRINITY_DN3516_c0_g2_i1.p1  ORF type:complete len:451 (+),score=82.54 TRINITY_DN3516_c0_g2_i1:66-1355(+)
MKGLLLVVAAWLVLNVFAAPQVMQPRPDFERRVGSHAVCFQDKQYLIEFDTLGAGNDSFIPLDNVTGLTAIQCNVDQTQSLMQFADKDSAYYFLDVLVEVTSFIIESEQISCANSTSPIRRVMGWEFWEDTLQVLLLSVPARYDEIFQDADVNVSSIGPCPMTVDKQICLGMNAASDCQSAAQPIPIYSNNYVSMSCSDCFLGFEVDIFLTLSIRWFHLNQLAGGFRNMGVHGALVFDMNAQAQWSTGVNKQINLVQPTTVVNFHIGVIPIRIWFQVPVQITADASFHSSAQATIGAQVNWNIGDLYIQWDPTNHWQHVTPSPSLSWTPQISGSAQFNADASFAVIPSIIMHVDNVFTYQVTLTPSLELSASGSTQSTQLCSKGTADVNFQSTATLNINIPWVHVESDKQFGPKTIYDSGSQTIFNACS